MQYTIKIVATIYEPETKRVFLASQAHSATNVVLPEGLLGTGLTARNHVVHRKNLVLQRRRDLDLLARIHYIRQVSEAIASGDPQYTALTHWDWRVHSLFVDLNFHP